MASVVVPLDEETVKLVLRQVEFYFSDSNLPRDNFLKKTVDESEDGLVSLALICSFARMRKHLDLGDVKAEDVPEGTLLAVAGALRRSPSLRVSEDGKRIGRNSALLKPEEVIEQVDSRTIAVSPLPYDVKTEDLESFFGHLGKVNSVRLPRHVLDKRHFCGTALIEFAADENVEKVLKESLVYAGVEIEIKPKQDFDAEMEKKRDEHCEKEASNESYPKGLIVALKLKSMPIEGSKEPNSTEACKTEVPTTTGIVNEGEEKTSENVNKDGTSSENVENENEKDAGNHLKESEQRAADTVSYETNDGVEKSSSLCGEGNNTASADGKDIVTREDLKEVFQKFGVVRYVDYRMGEESGYIRFDNPDAAVKARAVAVLTEDGGFVVKKFVITLEALTGDAEREYWNLLRGNQKDKYMENKSGRGRRGRHTRGGSHFDGKRSRGSDLDDGRSKKSQKVDAADD